VAPFFPSVLPLHFGKTQAPSASTRGVAKDRGFAGNGARRWDKPSGSGISIAAAAPAELDERQSAKKTCRIVDFLAIARHGIDMAPTTRRIAAIALTGMFVLLVAGYIAVGLVLDLFQGGTDLSMAALLAAGGAPLVLLAAWLGRRWMIGVSLAGILLVALLSLTCWHPRKVFVRDVESVQVGMTVDEVEDILGGYIKGKGAKFFQPRPPAYPTGEERRHATGVMTYRWNDHDAAYDADWGRVHFVGGRVTRREFLGD
jgi:hypothetical protein